MEAVPQAQSGSSDVTNVLSKPSISTEQERVLLF